MSDATEDASPRPWRVVDKPNGQLVHYPSIVENSDGLVVAFVCRSADAALICAAVNERDRLRDALDEVCSRVSVALNCTRHETEQIDLLVHALLGIKECARAAIGEGGAE